jgi:hypothetical protein
VKRGEGEVDEEWDGDERRVEGGRDEEGNVGDRNEERVGRSGGRGRERWMFKS